MKKHSRDHSDCREIDRDLYDEVECFFTTGSSVGFAQFLDVASDHYYSNTSEAKDELDAQY